MIRVAAITMLAGFMPVWYSSTLPAAASWALLAVVVAAGGCVWFAARQLSRHHRLVARLQVELAELKQQHSETLLVKERFLANMSHEIRTPMNGVFGMTDLLAETTLNDKQRRYVSTIRYSLESLLSITNDILDFSKIQEGSIRLESVRFPLDMMVEDVCEVHAEAAQKKGLELACDITAISGTFVKADQSRLRQVLHNLIGNAVKFTEQGEVSVCVAALDDNQFKFSIVDSGPGISATQKDQIFKEFYQGDNSTTRRFGGTGLGLTISNKLVALLGGELRLENNHPAGSVFSFTCTLAHAHSDSTEPECSLHGLRALVVDDNSTNSEILLHQLEQWGMQVTIADSGPSALNMLDQNTDTDVRFHVAVLDFHMPGMDGFELARHIQNHPVYSSIKMMMLTSSLTDLNDDDLLGLGIACSLTKPARQTALYHALTSLLQESVNSAQRNHAAEETESKPQILLTEDNPINQEVASLMLENIGCEVEIAENGADAVEALENKDFDLVLMDCQMPVMDGYEATKVIRSQSKQSHIPVIALTANAMAGDRELCLSSGMDDYLSKPVSQQHLQDAIDKWISRKDDAPPSRKQSELFNIGNMTMNFDIDETALNAIKALQRPGKPDILGKIVVMYLEKTPSLISDIETGIAANDAAKVKMAAHTLKSSSAYLGATTLADLCNKLEAKAANEDLSDASVEPISQGFVAVSEQIKRLA